MNVQKYDCLLTTPNHYNIEREQIHLTRKQTDKETNDSNPLLNESTQVALSTKFFLYHYTLNSGIKFVL